jgi:hypothetical protein
VIAQALPPEAEEDHLPRYVVALMFASDETMLTSFGNAKLWPGYMYFGNESKHRRGKASLKLFEEVAYFLTVRALLIALLSSLTSTDLQLPDAFNDWYIRLSGKQSVAKTLAAHLRREVFHAQWNILLDNEFIHAYQHGLIVDCPDQVRRRFYPRILAYAADYPERSATSCSTQCSP